MWHVYILECSDKSLYTGITNDLAKRLDEHNNAKAGAKYTKARRPVVLKYSKKARTRSKALQEEYRIKNLPRAEKIKLCQGLISPGKGAKIGSQSMPDHIA